MTIQDLIRLALDRSNATSLRHLGRMMETPSASVFQWQKGHVLPSDENMIKLARLAGFDEGEALLVLSIARTHGEARATYEALLQERHSRAA